MNDGLLPDEVIIGDKGKVKLFYFKTGDEEVLFTEKRSDGHIRWLPFYKARRAGVKKIYKALKNQDYDLPPFNIFRNQWSAFLKEYDILEEQKRSEAY